VELSAVRERVEALGGRLEVRSYPRKGMRVTAGVPLGTVLRILDVYDALADGVGDRP